MDVRMMCKRLAPRVKYGDESYLSAQVTWVGGDLLERVGGFLEKSVVHLAFILERERRDLGGEGEDSMKVLNGEEILAASFEPLGPLVALTLWAVAVAARIVGNLQVCAGITLLDVPAKLGCPTDSQVEQNALLGLRHPQAGHSTVGTNQVADDVGHLERRLVHQRGSAHGQGA